jgi:hypothetical protein
MFMRSLATGLISLSRSADVLKRVWLATAVACLIGITGRVPANAVLMGPAAAGDNCTPFNGYSIGYRTAFGARIIAQSVVLQRGWKLVGWILQDASRSAFFVPYEPYFDPANADASGGLPSLYPTGSIHDPAAGYAAFIRWRSANGLRTTAPTELSKPLLVSNCFTQPFS